MISSVMIVTKQKNLLTQLSDKTCKDFFQTAILAQLKLYLHMWQFFPYCYRQVH